MSDELDEDGTPEPRERVVRVKVDKDDSDDIRAKAERYDELVCGMADTLNEKHGTDLFSGKTLEDMQRLDQLLDSRVERKRSVGSVSLPSRQQSEDLLTKAYENPKDYVAMLKEHANNPNSPIYLESQEALQILQEQTFQNLPRVTEVTVGLEREAREELGDSFSHEQFTEWARRKERQRLSGQHG